MSLFGQVWEKLARRIESIFNTKNQSCVKSHYGLKKAPSMQSY